MTACTPDEPSTRRADRHRDRVTTPADTGTETGQATATATAAAVTLAPVTCEVLPREPTDEEFAWLVEPGPQSGAGDDEAAAVAAVRAQSPSSDEEWAQPWSPRCRATTPRRSAR